MICIKVLFALHKANYKCKFFIKLNHFFLKAIEKILLGFGDFFNLQVLPIEEKETIVLVFIKIWHKIFLQNIEDLFHIALFTELWIEFEETFRANIEITILASVYWKRILIDRIKLSA